ncbi:MAG: ribose-phosphate pyrophosphokinase [Bacteroidales bacterium]|nr:ribose-phosphate pyrophosphokinase [Bacteroidales bacterium]
MAKCKAQIFSGRASEYLATKIATRYGQPLGEMKFTTFADGEFQVCFEETIRGNDIFIIQSTCAPSDNLMELLLMIDAAKRASAARIIAVIPYFGFARQDRKDRPRVAIGSKLFADILTTAGISRMVTMDLHSDQIQGFFNVPVDHLYASSIFIPYLKQLKLPNLVMASPDTGGAKRANAYARFLNSELVLCYKQRSRANHIDKMTIIGDVAGKDVVLVDDIIDTGGTIVKAAELMKQEGANSVRALCTHAVFSKNAMDVLEKSVLDEVITTDTLPRETNGKIKVLSVATLFADVISRIYKHESISGHYEFPTIG